MIPNPRQSLTTNQVVGGSNLSGRANNSRAYAPVPRLSRTKQICGVRQLCVLLLAYNNKCPYLYT